MQNHEKAKIIYAQDLIEQSKAKKEKDLIRKVKDEKEEKKTALYNKMKHDIVIQFNIRGKTKKKRKKAK
jgi:hypothetical protein